MILNHGRKLQAQECFYAFITGVKNGWLNKEKYGPAARRAWLELTTYLNDNDQMTEVCRGTRTGETRKHYIDRPRMVGDLHGQAPILWCAVALLR